MTNNDWKKLTLVKYEGLRRANTYLWVDDALVFHWMTSHTHRSPTKAAHQWEQERVQGWTNRGRVSNLKQGFLKMECAYVTMKILGDY